MTTKHCTHDIFYSNNIRIDSNQRIQFILFYVLDDLAKVNIDYVFILIIFERCFVQIRIMKLREKGNYLRIIIYVYVYNHVHCKKKMIVNSFLCH